MKLALIGYGKMGRAIEEIAIQRGHQVALIIDQHNLDDFTKENLSGIDAAIEFTGPHSALSNVQQMLEWGTPLVCGSTGWTDQLDAMKAICAERKGGFVYSSNFSIGVNLFFELNKKLAGEGPAAGHIQMVPGGFRLSIPPSEKPDIVQAQ